MFMFSGNNQHAEKSSEPFAEEASNIKVPSNPGIRLLDAAIKGDIEEVTQLIDAEGVDVNVTRDTSEAGKPPKRGILPHLSNPENVHATALHITVSTLNLELVNILLERKADAGIQNKEGQTALQLIIAILTDNLVSLKQEQYETIERIVTALTIIDSSEQKQYKPTGKDSYKHHAPLEMLFRALRYQYATLIIGLPVEQKNRCSFLENITINLIKAQPYEITNGILNNLVSHTSRKSTTWRETINSEKDWLRIKNEVTQPQKLKGANKNSANNSSGRSSHSDNQQYPAASSSNSSSSSSASATQKKSSKTSRSTFSPAKAIATIGSVGKKSKTSKNEAKLNKDKTKQPPKEKTTKPQQAEPHSYVPQGFV